MSLRTSARRSLLFLGQVCVSLALVYYAFGNVDSAHVTSLVLHADARLLLLCVLLLGGQQALLAWRWILITRSIGGTLPFLPAVRYVWIGSFYSQVLPASVGGDIVRMWLYWVRCRSRRLAINSVVLERLIMVMALLLLALAVQPGLVERGVPQTLVLSSIVFLVLLIAALVFLVLGGTLLGAYEYIPFARGLAAASSDVVTVFRNIPGTALVVSVCAASYLNLTVSAWLIARALGLQITLADCVVLFPTVLIAATLPVSVGGWGVRETAAIAVFGFVGVSTAEALALSVLFGLAGIVASVPGSFMWLTRNRRREDRVDSTLAEQGLNPNARRER